MSTKSTIVHGDNFHFYEDLLDKDGSVYLSITEPCGHYSTIKIPPHIWEAIRKKHVVDLSLAEVSDDALRARVESEVDARIAEYNKTNSAWTRMNGFAVFGDVANNTRDEQISAGMSYYMHVRTMHQEIVAKIGSCECDSWEDIDELDRLVWNALAEEQKRTVYDLAEEQAREMDEVNDY